MVGMVNYLKYSYGSTKGSSVAGTEFASALNYHGSDVNYTNSVVDDEALISTSAKVYEGNLGWTPVSPKSVAIEFAPGVLITDNGAGQLVATGTTLDATATTSNKIDYATGAYSITLTNDPAEALSATYMYDNESVPVKTPEINLSIESLPIQTKSRKLKALYSFDASYELQKELRVA